MRKRQDDKWIRIMTALSSVIPIYDKANKLISLGKDVRLREDAITETLKDEGTVLDAGCGLGKMSELIFLKTNVREVVLMDPLKAML
ncbi:methylase, partial [Candidatus Geothermarchaeota archaeon]